MDWHEYDAVYPQEERHEAINAFGDAYRSIFTIIN